MNKLLPITFLATTTALGGLGCGHLDYTVEPVKRLEPVNKPEPRSDYCDEVSLKNGTYAGMVEGNFLKYEVQDGKCKAYAQSNCGEVVLIDYGCDSLFNTLYSPDFERFFFREQIGEGEFISCSQDHLDTVLKKGQLLVCPKNKIN